MFVGAVARLLKTEALSTGAVESMKITFTLLKASLLCLLCEVTYSANEFMSFACAGIAPGKDVFYDRV